jgi:hypothetical protein
VKLLWRDAVRAQAAVAMPPPVWANGAGAHHIAFGLPTDDGALEFRFHRGQPAYARLVSTPGLRARIAADAANGRILSVTFRGKA